MNRFYLFTCFLFYIQFSTIAQSIEIRGRITDTLQIPLVAATILILDAKDSSYISFTQTDNEGNFKVRQKLKNPFILKVTYLGYFAFEKIIDPAIIQIVDLGNVALTQINTVLFEVIIKEAKAPLKMRGDTLEYDATTFKVPAGSTVEDLLRRLPGMAVGADGAITSHGQSVNKVTVDGKRFFGDDPTMATKNLPAESVSKVQVFNEKSEQEKLTGLTLEKDQKTMNLELKDDFKKGGFGKILAGIGMEERNESDAGNDQIIKTELKGNYNKFDKKIQLSLIGVQNNTGRNGMNWNDHQDFRGQQSWEWNSAEEIFGFGYSSGMIFNSPGGGDEESDDFGGTVGFFGDQNSGFPQNALAGINYNYDFNKVKFTGMYSFRQNDLFSRADRVQQFLLPGSNYLSTDLSEQNRKNNSHRVEFIYENEFDSLNSMILKLRGNAVFTQTDVNSQFVNSKEPGIINGSLVLSKNAERANYGWQGVAYYKRKFKNKKRNFGINFIYNNNDRSTDEYLNSENEFYSGNTIDSVSLLNQFIEFETDIRSIKSSALYVEPIARNLSLQFFINYLQRDDQLGRDVFDDISDSLVLNKNYSRNNDHVFRMKRAGSIIQYGKDGKNISFGIAVQNIQLVGQFNEGVSQLGSINRSYDNFLATVSGNIQISNDKRIGLSYYGNIQEPSFKSLTPIVDNTNPIYIRLGNPDLNPEKWHQLNLHYYANNKIRFINYNLSMNYNFYDNQHITEQIIDTFLVTSSKLINYNGGQRFNVYAGFGFPIIKNRLTVNLNYNYNYFLTKSLINYELNEADRNSHSVGANISYTPNEKYSIYSDNRWSFAQTKYSIKTSQNNITLNQFYNLSLNAKLLFKIYINSSLNFRLFENELFDTKYEIPILNASIYRLFLKGDRLELRLSTYDLLNKNRSINQIANVNIISETQTMVLTRYYLISLSYNIKGIRASVKRSNDWMF